MLYLEDEKSINLKYAPEISMHWIHVHTFKLQSAIKSHNMIIIVS